MENVYEWIIKNGDLTTEVIYPCTSGTGVTGVCAAKKITVKKVHISDYCDLIPEDEKDLEKALVQQVSLGPCPSSPHTQAPTHSARMLASSFA